MEERQDLISRQAAIDTLADMYCKPDEDGFMQIPNGIDEELPFN